MSALDRYQAATRRWQDANAARDQAAQDRARAISDMAWEGQDERAIADQTGLSVPRVQQLIAKGENR